MAEKTKTQWNQRSIYIPTKFFPYWKEILKEAKKRNEGPGAFICRVWPEVKKILSEVK